VGCPTFSKFSGTTNEFRQRAKLSKSLPPNRLQSVIGSLLIADWGKQPAMSRPPKLSGGDD